MTKQHLKKLGIFLFAAFALTSCGGDRDIQVYRLAKDDEQQQNERAEMEQLLPQPEVHSAKITWSAPNSWDEQPAGGMRKGSFLVKAPDGSSVDISIIFLEGSAGGDLANVNRWRQQISLPPWSEQELREREEMVETPLGPSRIYDFASEQTRTIAAILPFQHGTWFFKLQGEDRLVTAEKAHLFQLMKSVQAAN